ncbi:hypothetical protein pb186bvf_011208 [Paramecium bursaria]
MQLKKMLKFRYKDLPKELTCIICKSVCQNPRQQEHWPFNPYDCDRANSSFSIEFRNQIEQFIQIQCDYCGNYQKYFHFKIHSTLCQLIFQKSQFLQKFKQISLSSQMIRCCKCDQIAYRPEMNDQNKLICLFCIKQENIQNIQEPASDYLNILDQFIYQCNFVNCQKYVKLNNLLRHYKKCQLKDSEIIKSEEYLQLISQDKEYQQFKQYYKKNHIGLKYQKQQIFNFVKQGYDLAKTKFVKKQLIQKIINLENHIDTISDPEL